MNRILIFSLAYYPLVGGDGVAIREITKRISPEDIEFHMVTLRFQRALLPYEKIGNVHVYRIGPIGSGRIAKFIFQFAAALKGSALNKKHRYGAVWSMMAHSAGVPGALFKFFHPSVPFILTLQEGDPPEHVERVMRPLWLLFARAFIVADIVQVISSFLGAWARRRGFKGVLEVIPNGVDIENFSNTSNGEAKALADSLGKKEGEVFLITTSRLVHKNAVDDVLRALALLPSHIHFLILGIGSEEEKLKSLARELGVDSRVRFLGFVPHEEMPKYLHASDIFIRPSRSEGMGNSFIEAMAAGLPVIATQEGGIADFLFDAKKNPGKPSTGWAVDTDSPQQIAEAVKEILADQEKTADVVARARSVAVLHYNWDSIAKAMREKVFGPVLEKSLKNT